MTDFNIPLDIQMLSNEKLTKAVRICHCSPPSADDYKQIADIDCDTDLLEAICKPLGCPCADFCSLDNHTGDKILAELLRRFERLSTASLGNFYDDIDCAKPMPEL